MIYKLIGTGMHNQGAELMAYAAAEAVYSGPIPGPVVADGFGTPVDYLRNGLVKSFDLHGRVRGTLGRFIFTESLRKSLSLPRSSQIDCVLNAEGFAYSDQWGTRPSRMLNELVSQTARSGIPYIMLPQAFGPFENEEIRTLLKDALPKVTMICARDKISEKHLTGLIGHSNNVHYFRDFTNLVRPTPSRLAEKVRGSCILVPNIRMLDKTSRQVAEDYVKLLQVAINELQSDYKIFVLSHSSDDDHISQELIQKNPALEAISERDPRRMKGVLGAAALVIGSRFHALQSALDEGTPSLSLGWSHKYEELFKDYGWDDGILPLDQGPEIFREKLKSVVSMDLAQIRQRLAAHSFQLRSETVEMWETIFATIEAASRSRAI
jgi:polysaccharide pyruvyl transferase WcaK-like protein